MNEFRWKHGTVSASGLHAEHACLLRLLPPREGGVCVCGGGELTWLCRVMWHGTFRLWNSGSTWPISLSWKDVVLPYWQGMCVCWGRVERGFIWGHMPVTRRGLMKHVYETVMAWPSLILFRNRLILNLHTNKISQKLAQTFNRCEATWAVTLFSWITTTICDQQALHPTHQHTHTDTYISNPSRTMPKLYLFCCR